jgi:hypothetical protein
MVHVEIIDQRDVDLLICGEKIKAESVRGSGAPKGSNSLTSFQYRRNALKRIDRQKNTPIV